MRILKFILLFLTIPSLGLLLWMNLTPGYFQVGDCFCKVGYFTSDRIKADRQNPQCHLLDCLPPSKLEYLLWNLELNLAKLDFNRGDVARPSTPDYVCPKTEWVDCMPGPGPVKSQCQPDYLNWASKNCPGFKGGAM